MLNAELSHSVMSLENDYGVVNPLRWERQLVVLRGCVLASDWLFIYRFMVRSCSESESNCIIFSLSVPIFKSLGQDVHEKRQSYMDGP